MGTLAGSKLGTPMPTSNSPSAQGFSLILPDGLSRLNAALTMSSFNRRYKPMQRAPLPHWPARLPSEFQIS